jgi:cellulose synthase/poly-beta-1,6-N-acetylglucosamine synthase-like glycosyltransferase
MLLPIAIPRLDCHNGDSDKTSSRTLIVHIVNHLYHAGRHVEAIIQGWTPFLLVASYFTFSTCIYMICTPELITIFWFIYLTTNFYIAGSTVVEALMSLAPSKEARKALRMVEQNNWVFPTPDDELSILDLVIVAYLPNERDIIIDRIHWALEKIVFPKDKIRINVVYNTPVAILPLEDEMHELALKHSQLRVIKVPGSKSKADNLNYFLSLQTGSDIIAILDCDHYAHPYGPRFAVENFMADRTVDIVQGRCVIFNSQASWLASLIAVEFDKIYAVSHPGRAACWDFGIFGGSNGYWRASLLRELRMDGSMLTEDIDSSMRALSQSAKTVHDLNVVSYELAPNTVAAFWKQRLRWAQGWAQVTMRHLKLAFNRPECGQRTLTQRFGLVSLLLIRELSYYLVTQYCCLVLSIVIMAFPTTPTLLLKFLFFQYPVAYWFFIIRCVSPQCFFRSCRHQANRSFPQLHLSYHESPYHMARAVGICYSQDDVIFLARFPLLLSLCGLHGPLRTRATSEQVLIVESYGEDVMRPSVTFSSFVQPSLPIIVEHNV